MPEDRLDNLLNEMREETIPAEEVTAAKDTRLGEDCRLRLDSLLRIQSRSGSIPRRQPGRLAAAAGRGPPRAAARPAGVPWPRARAGERSLLSSCAAGSCRPGLVGPSPPDWRPPPCTSEETGSTRPWLRPAPPPPSPVSKGGLYRLPQGILAQGAAVSDGEVVRTGQGARAVLRLRDGSLVEVNERSELSVQSAWSGQTLRLERGDVIVQAAKQRRGHLRVTTRDTTASVKGTVFAVSTGLAGSLVSVVEGSVRVQQPGGVLVLTRGEQAASTAAVRGVPLRRSLAWSQKAVQYFELLGELDKIQTALVASGVSAPRTEPKLLPYLPSGAVLYFAIPNLGPIAQQATILIEQRAQDSAVLRDWWNSARSQTVKQIFERMQSLAPMVGDEIVFVLTRDPLGVTRPAPLLPRRSAARTAGVPEAGAGPDHDRRPRRGERLRDAAGGLRFAGAPRRHPPPLGAGFRYPVRSRGRRSLPGRRERALPPRRDGGPTQDGSARQRRCHSGGGQAEVRLL